MDILIPTPEGFSFKRTVRSHGWCELPPFDFNVKEWALLRVVDLPASDPIPVRITEADAGINARIPGRPNRVIRDHLERTIRHMFRLDEDMSAFYQAMRGESEFEWIANQGAGRLLRGPTVFEDLVKMICTTNCSWSLTEKIVGAMVSHLGRETLDGRRAFPTPAEMDLAPASYYVSEAKAGYRAPFLKELAARVCSGELDVEGWFNSEMETPDLMKAIKQVKGAGDYVAENMLRLLGRYDGLALDSSIRSGFMRIRNRGRAATDKKIARFYARFGQWKGLVLWCDMTRQWLTDEGDATW